MPEAQHYSAEYYEMSRSGHGARGVVDTVRDRFIRRQVLSRVPGGALLDVGCGLGLFLAAMQPHFELYGLDLSPYAIEQARLRLPKARLAVGSLTDAAPGPDRPADVGTATCGGFGRTFDVVSAINIMEHLEDPGAGLDAARASLRRGGLFVVHMPTIGNRVQARLYAGSYAKDPTHIYRPSGSTFAELARQHGFRLEFATYAPFLASAVWRQLPWHPAYLALFRAV